MGSVTEAHLRGKGPTGKPPDVAGTGHRRFTTGIRRGATGAATGEMTRYSRLRQMPSSAPVTRRVRPARAVRGQAARHLRSGRAAHATSAPGRPTRFAIPRKPLCMIFQNGCSGRAAGQEGPFAVNFCVCWRSGSGTCWATLSVPVAAQHETRHLPVRRLWPRRPLPPMRAGEGSAGHGGKGQDLAGAAGGDGHRG